MCTGWKGTYHGQERRKRETEKEKWRGTEPKRYGYSVVFVGEFGGGGGRGGGFAVDALLISCVFASSRIGEKLEISWETKASWISKHHADVNLMRLTLFNKPTNLLVYKDKFLQFY